MSTEVTTKAPAEILPSIIRTVTPYLVGALVTFAVKHGIALDANQTLTLGVVVSGMLYSLIRWLEVNVSDKWGYALGFKKKPVYAEMPAVVVDSTGTTVYTEDDAAAHISNTAPALPESPLMDDKYVKVDANEIPSGDDIDSTTVTDEGAPA